MVTLAKKARKKLEILNNAKKLFARFGLKKTSLDDVARSLGMAKTSLYYYFKSKGDLFNAVIKDESEQLLTRLQGEIEQHESSKEQLKAYLLARVTHLNDLCNLRKLMGKTPRKRPRQVEKIYHSFVQLELKMVQKILTRGIAQKIFKPFDAQLIAASILTISNKFGTSMTTYLEHPLKQEEYHQVIDLLFSGLLKE